MARPNSNLRPDITYSPLISPNPYTTGANDLHVYTTDSVEEVCSNHVNRAVAGIHHILEPFGQVQINTLI